ncbi:MAG: hypothetical protein RMM53_12735, partial [Bacteroidia bacterium]|nr:hypothetical protein [Bacteroidia bacterium]
LDTDAGVDLERCAEIAVALRDALCGATEKSLQELGNDYEIEVGSPGVGSALRHPRQYRANIGRTLRLTTTENQTFEGKIVHADETGVTLEVKTSAKKPAARLRFDAERIAQAKVTLHFNDVVK